ncbi:MAG: hypothetical protein HYV61_06840 [Candidatus Rokubacteria bacterium]|nr:hypothetical protein [Candidatus Rokubacteria bacterium]
MALEGPDRLAVAVNRSLPGVGPASLILAAPPAPVRPLVDGIPAILLAVDEDGDGVKETLWGQGSEAGRLAAGRVVRYRYQEGRLTPEGAVEVPAGFRATGAVLASLTKGGGRELVYIDADRRLVVARGRIELWRSPVRVGGGGPGVEAPEPNLFARDLDGDGVEEVLVPRNLAAGQGFTAGEVVILRRQEDELTLETLGPQFDGVVSGVAVLGRTPPSLLVAVAKRADPRGGGGESRIFLARGS